MTSGLLDDPLLLRARGAGPEDELVWRARYRDDDARVWRATAARAPHLHETWEPAKAGTGPLAALLSLRPVSIDVRVESPDGRTASRTLSRRLLAEGVRVRRWRDGLTATLYRPAGDAYRATVLIDASSGSQQTVVAALAGSLLASRGVLALAVAPARKSAESARAGLRAATGSAALDVARERLAAVPGVSAEIQVLSVLDPFADAVGVDPADVGPAQAEAANAGQRAVVVLPPGVGTRGGTPAALRALAWDELLDRLGAQRRVEPALDEGAPDSPDGDADQGASRDA
ncbi:MAG TPA: hypothetical protein VLJ42_04075 [Solirubrobacteraceae bacterium]|nr:hypothetical protein [Solirubrobacteraceae bacterium]